MKHCCFQSVQGRSSPMSTAERVPSTREQILVLLRRHGRLSAPRLADLLKINSVGVRRHLGLLERDGLVEATVEKPKRGRPAASYACRVDGATLAERTDALAEVLSEQGFMAEVESAPDGLRLCQHNCTVEQLAAELPDLCTSEAELFERLLGTRVEREATVVDGAVRCVTRIDLGKRGKRPQDRTTTSPTRKATRSPA